MYTRAYQLMALPATYLGQVLERVLFPAMAKEQGAPQRLRRIFFSSLEAMTLIGLPMSVVMFSLSHEIILVLFGRRWESLVPVLTILSLGVFCRTAYKSSDTLARSLGAVYHTQSGRAFIR
jgi:O-antigen/teichoic acid export membrane protein